MATDWSEELERSFAGCSWSQRTDERSSRGYLFKIHPDPDSSSRITSLLIYSLTTGTLFFETISFSRFNRSCQGGTADLPGNSQASYSETQKEDHWRERIGLVERAVGKRKKLGDRSSVEVEENKHSLTLSLSLSNDSDASMPNQPFRFKLDEVEVMDRSTSSRVVSTQLVQALIGAFSSVVSSLNESQVRELEQAIDRDASRHRESVPNQDPHSTQSPEGTFAALARWSQVSSGLSPVTSIPVSTNISCPSKDRATFSKHLKEMESGQPLYQEDSSPRSQSRDRHSSPNASLSMTLDESRILPSRIPSHPDSQKRKSPNGLKEKRKDSSNEESIASTTIRSSSRSNDQSQVDDSLTGNFPAASPAVTANGRARPKLIPAGKDSDSSDSSEDEPDASSAKPSSNPNPNPKTLSKSRNYLQDDSDDDDDFMMIGESPDEKDRSNLSFNKSDSNLVKKSSAGIPHGTTGESSKQGATSRIRHGSDDSLTDDESPRKKKERSQLANRSKEKDNVTEKPDFIMPYPVPGLDQGSIQRGNKSIDDDDSIRSSTKAQTEKGREKEKGKGKGKAKESSFDTSSDSSATEDEEKGTGEGIPQIKPQDIVKSHSTSSDAASNAAPPQSSRSNSEELKRKRVLEDEEQEARKLSEFLGVPITYVDQRGRGRGRALRKGF